MTPTWSLGVDPGVDGAAVALDAHGSVIFSLGWHRLARAAKRGGRYAWEVTSGDGMWHRDVVFSLAAVPSSALELAHRASARVAHGEGLVVIEGVFGRGRTLEALAEVAGVWVHACHSMASDPTRPEWRPRATTWRPVVLGCPPGTPSEQVDVLTLAWCREWHVDLGALADNGHAREAACLAWYGLRIGGVL